MLFSSITFLWLFLPIVLAIYFLLLKIFGHVTFAANLLLLVASLFFYAWGEPIYVVLMLGSIILNWLMGLWLSRTHSSRAILALACAGNLAILGYFKYAGMVIDTLNALCGKVVFADINVSLPIGISFFTFQSMSYVIDVYRGECTPQKNVLKLALYISFFPQLIAGPIVKYKDVADQIDNRIVTRAIFASGVRRFEYGLAKKVLIANVLALGVDKIYSMQMGEVTGLLAWTASLMYTFQIYYDFSGYSDMAIGLGRMFGFKFRENFNYPYTALSIREFWRRWHMSLCAWFKDYVYIPLGGNRAGKLKTYRNLGIVFFSDWTMAWCQLELCGLGNIAWFSQYHRASWSG